MNAGLAGEALIDVVASIDADNAAPVRSANAERQARYRQRLSLSAKDWSFLRDEVIARDGEMCAYCGSTSGPFHVDHIVPLILGGDNDLSNLCVACAPCNFGKSGRTPEQMEWR